MRHSLHYFVQSTVKSLGIRSISVLCGVLTTVILAGALGTEDYGTYLYTVNLVMIASAFALFGLPVLLTRQISEYEATRNRTSVTGLLVFSALYTAVAATISILAISVGDSYFKLIPTSNVYIYVALLLILFPTAQILISALYGYQAPIHAAFVEGIVRPVSLLVVLGVLLQSGTLSVHTSLAAFSGSIVVTIVAALWLTAHFYRPTKSTKGKMVARFALRSWATMLLPLGAISMTATVNSKVDIFLLGNISSLENVAIYGIAMQIVGLAKMVRATSLGIAGPKFTELWAKNDLNGINRLVCATNRLNLIGAIMIAIILVLFAEPIVKILVGDAYSESALLAVFAAVNITLVSVLGPSPVLLMMCGYEKYFLRSSIAMAFFNVVLNFVLIPKFGALGALMASLISETTFQLLCLKFCKTMLGINTMRLRQ